ncbi:serine hydrolase domain-containing protein [soil metagenome]
MRRLDLTLKVLWSADPIPAIGASLRFNGELVWRAATGVAERTTGAALQPGARVPIYSLTKTFTAVIVLQLAREGTFTLRDSPRRWFPDLPVPETLTIAHLLRHTSGLKDYFGSHPAYRDAVLHRPTTPWTHQEFLDEILPRGLIFEPGNGWSYSNIGYLILLQIIERTTGCTFAQNVSRRIAVPLALEDTFVAEELADWQTCSPGYGSEVSPTGEPIDVRSCYHPGWCAPGVAVSTAQDTTLFYDLLLEGKILHPEDLADMCDLVPVPGNHPPAVRPSCGMGLLGDPGSPFGPTFGHGGGGPGYSIWASTLKRPTGRLTIMVFCTASGYRSEPMQQALLQTACDIFG